MKLTVKEKKKLMLRFEGGELGDFPIEERFDAKAILYLLQAQEEYMKLAREANLVYLRRKGNNYVARHSYYFLCPYIYV